MQNRNYVGKEYFLSGFISGLAAATLSFFLLGVDRVLIPARYRSAPAQIVPTYDQDFDNDGIHDAILELENGYKIPFFATVQYGGKAASFFSFKELQTWCPKSAPTDAEYKTIEDALNQK